MQPTIKFITSSLGFHVIIPVWFFRAGYSKIVMLTIYTVLWLAIL